ncbi:VOC family protein [Solihabitans fulvus]|uniref:VOC family protein n=1 Tax=Solihabitans fulvus TaxID=1892852 RepID=A0A5B2WYT3_9PSEU|nr:VOC family protein [Solihabitans fulvus]KAA2256070.1 VOC family protein [Solihabitans fulvus]
MSVELNHTIVSARDRAASAEFLASVLGLPKAEPFGPFLALRLANNLTLDVMQVDGEVASQHYAFLVGDDEFDEIFGRIRDRGIRYWADPMHTRAGEVNDWNGGRGVYFEDPSGHNLEILTRA